MTALGIIGAVLLSGFVLVVVLALVVEAIREARGLFLFGGKHR